MSIVQQNESSVKQDFWQSVWSILQKECGTGRDQFGFVHSAGNFSEWRFQGDLGFGGKIYNKYDGLRVSCYPEDMTPERKAMIERANERLAELCRRGEAAS